MTENNYFCEACNKYIDIRGKSGHLRSKKHLLNVSRLEDRKTQEEPEEEPEELKEEPEEEEEEMPEESIGNIKIVTDGDNKEKSSFDKIAEFLFSPQVAPVTMSILDNIGNMLNNKSQKDAKQEEGQLVKTVSGAMVHVKNKNF